MEADFSGWATKAGLKCSDGRTIMPNAFQQQDKQRVPLVWQHGHTDPQNVLGHTILENRPEGVYAYGFFNDSDKANHARGLIKHNDINMLSIWANQLIERSGRVIHGAIREVSLVLSGANPGAVIENVSIRHSDGEDDILDDEAIIYTGLELQHSYEKQNDERKTEMIHANDNVDNPDETIQDVYDSMSQKQKDVLHYMVGQAIEDSSVKHDGLQETMEELADLITKGYDTMGHSNVFESKEEKSPKHILSHSELNGIVADAGRTGSLKEAVESYALSHGIEDIDNLFPDAALITDLPEFRKRRSEWVNKVLESVRKSPFARIKTLSADLTFEDARAKGYVKGTMKREEFFPIVKRVTTPTTIYKKQKLDRDDMIDITDFDVVTWLKSEMRIMLDEEIARVILIGDGRDVSHEDKINEQNLRPIANDNEIYTTTVNVNIDDSNSSAAEIVDAIITNRSSLRGSGLPTFFTTETYIARFMLLKDTTGRRIYKSLDELASELRVQEIVPVEAMEEDSNVVGILVNPIDYVVGADRGGQVSMFDDFDIDYNQYKYLIETRISGALVKLKSAIVVRKVAGSVGLINPTAPTFNVSTGVVTIPTQTGVVYKNEAGTTLTAGAQTAIAAGDDITIYAYPSSSSYAFNSSEDDTWNFVRED